MPYGSSQAALGIAHDGGPVRVTSYYQNYYNPGCPKDVTNPLDPYGLTYSPAADTPPCICPSGLPDPCPPGFTVPGLRDVYFGPVYCAVPVYDIIGGSGDFLGYNYLFSYPLGVQWGMYDPLHDGTLGCPPLSNFCEPVSLDSIASSCGTGCGWASCCSIYTDPSFGETSSVTTTS